jgi:F-box/leucine-rich repeat protein 14
MLLLRGSFTDRGMTQLAELDGLFGLNVDDAKLAITGAGLAPLVSLPHLGFLGFDAKDDSMPYIAALPELRFLMCQDTTAGDDGFVALSRSQSIEQIWGRRCHNLRSRGFAALASMPALRSLSVSCLNVGDDGLSALPDFPALRELMPMDVRDEGYRFVGQCAALESLVLMYCRDTTDRATEHITGLSRLARYFASYTQITDRTPELLSGMGSLEHITLSGCAGVTDAGIAALTRLPRLRDLRLSGMQRVTRNAASGFPPNVDVEISV